jgi:hypothetical protein
LRGHNKEGYRIYKVFKKGKKTKGGKKVKEIEYKNKSYNNNKKWIDTYHG